MSTTTAPAPVISADLSRNRIKLMRSGYLFMVVGLAIVKWPLLADAHTLPLYEGVTLCLLTAMSLLALIGLRHPVALLPVLVFESVWKVIWLSLVALPLVVAGDLDPAASQVLVNCSLVVLIIAVTPWRYVWRRYVGTPGERWR